MRPARLAFLGLVALWPCIGCGRSGTVILPPPAPEPVIRLEGNVFTVTDPIVLPYWGPPSEKEGGGWAAVFSVRVGTAPGNTGLPPLLGTYRLDGDTLRFEPRFPPRPGTTYTALYDPARALEASPHGPVTARFAVPKPERPPTAVTHVYPSRAVLPENHLRFYVHFSAPMARGEAYDHIKLLGGDGKPVEHPFLELFEELWDTTGTRFTLLIDPGRIKRGLKPREDLGPSLEEGKSYTLVIGRDWPDAEGDPLKEPYRKAFRVVAPDERQLDAKAWKITPPAAGSSDALAVAFPKPLDHAMLERVLRVTDDKGQGIDGTASVTDEETRWHFKPKDVWKAGAYALVADAALEDPSGNSLASPFEVDEFKPIQRRLETKTVTIPFAVRP